MSNTHLFAFFYAPLSSTINDPTLVHRLGNVLRLQPGNEIILFNRQEHALCTISAISNKSITVQITERKKNKILTPSITVLLPLLKREAFEQALYLATELGANQIQLIKTEKSLSKWQAHDHERAERIIIAAAEQSKQFTLPQLHDPLPLQTAIQTCPKPLIVATIDGKPIAPVLLEQPYQSLSLLIGPEGDFSPAEYALLDGPEIDRARLTPTVLRSEHALALLLGIARSIL